MAVRPLHFGVPRTRTWHSRLIASVFFVFLSLAAFADTLTGKVVKITDGDTLYVLDANYKEHKIRLAGIDAPERKQAL